MPEKLSYESFNKRTSCAIPMDDWNDLITPRYILVFYNLHLMIDSYPQTRESFESEI